MWIAYSREPPHLPVAISETAEDLAKKCGVSPSTVFSAFWRYSHGKAKTSRYHKVDTVAYTDDGISWKTGDAKNVKID